MVSEKILIIKTSSLGDIIHAFPSLDFLRQKFPSAKIHWVVEEPFKDLVQAHPKIDKVLCIRSKEWRKKFFNKNTFNEIKNFSSLLRQESYDYVFDLQGNIKSSLILSITKAKNKIGFGKKSVPEWPNLFFTNHRYNPPSRLNIREDYLFLIQSFFKDSGGNSTSTKLRICNEDCEKIEHFSKSLRSKKETLIMVCPGSAWPNKQLKEETLINFLKRINHEFQGYFYLIWGNEDEKKWVERINANFINHSEIIEKCHLPFLQNLMSEMNLVISMDSLPLHLAEIAGTKTFSIFGPSLGSKYAPSDKKTNSFYQGKCPYGKSFDKRCPILRSCSTGACMKEIHSEDLFNYFQNWWKSLAP